ncbi:MAG: hypothetical protein LBM03_00650 [Erysipelotrichaceae bacterium]|jgi:predicted DNA-binding protein YlxM (UPF0122 family)|nr:hypothetical protein [Erysipelotrichaceae bacterium]
MNNIKDFIKINELLDLYGELLSNKQKEIMTDYFKYNLSFGEIAENNKISRAAVADTITKSVKKLNNYEKMLQISAEKKIILKHLEEISSSKDVNKIDEFIAKIKEGK